MASDWFQWNRELQVKYMTRGFTNGFKYYQYLLPIYLRPESVHVILIVPPWNDFKEQLIHTGQWKNHRYLYVSPFHYKRQKKQTLMEFFLSLCISIPPKSNQPGILLHATGLRIIAGSLRIFRFATSVFWIFQLMVDIAWQLRGLGDLRFHEKNTPRTYQQWTSEVFSSHLFLWISGWPF